MRQYELVERVRAYAPDVDEDRLNRAYVFTVQMHGAQKRASGDPYFTQQTTSQSQIATLVQNNHPKLQI